MYRILIADDDVLMREALKVMISRDDAFTVVDSVGSGECAVSVCQEYPVDIIFMDMQMPGITGLEASRIIHQMNPDISIYMLSAHASSLLIRNAGQDTLKDVLEKPITFNSLKKILENYKTEHEDTAHEHIKILVDFLVHKDFKGFYESLPGIIENIYSYESPDPARLVKIFTYLGQNLLNMREIYDSSYSITDRFPLNEGLIIDSKISELWLFRVMDYLFCQNSISRYPLLEQIFIYIEKHIKEDISLNSIIENCAVSQGYLSRIFRDQFHVSVTEYLHMKKMHLAKGYFYFTEDSIADVAFRLGYNESSYFSKVFKKYEKMTVKEYKKKMRQKPGKAVDKKEDQGYNTTDAY